MPERGRSPGAKGTAYPRSQRPQKAVPSGGYGSKAASAGKAPGKALPPEIERTRAALKGKTLRLPAKAEPAEPAGDDARRADGDAGRSPNGDSRRSFRADTLRPSQGDSRQSSQGGSQRSSQGDSQRSSQGDSLRSSHGDSLRSQKKPGNATFAAPASAERASSRPDQAARPGLGAKRPRPAGAPKAAGFERRPAPESTARSAAGPGRQATAASPPPPRPAAGADDLVRVSKLLAAQGLCSRREADAFIERGLVFVDGAPVTELGTRVRPDAKVTLAPEATRQQDRQMTLLLHKPIGYVSGQPEPGFQPAVVLIQPQNQARAAGDLVFEPRWMKGLAPAGRLDIDSTGLLVLTQDGRVARQLIGDESTVEKEYLVRVEGRLIEQGLALLNHGLSLDGKQLRPARVEWLNQDQLRFILREGRKRQIRRMCELVGLTVVGLKRVRIGKVKLGDLPLGQWRYLRPDETF